MANCEIDVIEANLPGIESWVIINEIATNPQFLIAQNQEHHLHNFDHKPREAYDIGLDITRYHELEAMYDDKKARQFLLDELVKDLSTHFGELGGSEGRVGGFSYRYLINESGELAEDSLAKQPIREMFDGQDGIVANLWLEHLIPTMETMPVGSIIFNLSARQQGKYEGKYDYAYLFQKQSETEIHCYGLEVILSSTEQAAILNHQYQKYGALSLLLTDNPSADEVRGRAIVFEPGTYKQLSEAYADIVGEIMSLLRTGWKLSNVDVVQKHMDRQIELLQKKHQWISQLASELTESISNYNIPKWRIRQKLAAIQERELWKYDPEFMEWALRTGQREIMLPCGIVSLGDSLVTSEVWTYHIGTCRHCHASGVEVGPCEICKECEKLPEMN